MDPYGRSAILTGAIKIHIKVIYVFYPSDIFHFHSFGCHLGSQLGSLLQKCDPDRCAQNSHKSRLCFITHQTFPIFIPLAVPWGSNLDPCGKNVILAGARKIHIKVVYFFTCQTFSIFIRLSVPWDPNLDPCGENVVLAGARKIHIKLVCVLLPIRHFPCSFLWLSLGVPAWILAAKM